MTKKDFSIVKNIMSTKSIKSKIWFWVFAVYFLCFVLRIVEYFFIRTDSTLFGEAFIHKMLGIIILFWIAWVLSFNIEEIGFSNQKIIHNLFIGLLLGIFCFSIGYIIEILVLQNSGIFKTVSLFVTSYSVTGNLGNHTELIFFVICFAGNIINVVMEESVFRGLFQKLFERRYSFWLSAFFASVLFGFWHCIAPIRSFTDGDINKMQLIINLLILIGSSTLIGLKYTLLHKLTGSLFAGMADHFVNNTIVNILHVVDVSGIDQLQIIRISIAQTISFVILLFVYLRIQQKHNSLAKKVELQF